MNLNPFTSLNTLLARCLLLMFFSAPMAYGQELSAAKTDAQITQGNAPQQKDPQTSAVTQSATAAAPQTAADEVQECEEEVCQTPAENTRSNVPLGARISDALTRQDAEAAEDILEHDRLLMNDEMNLLLLSGRGNEAADIGFTLMQRSDQDESLYEQVAPILMLNSRHSGAMATFYAFESYNAFNNQVNSYGHHLGSFKVDFLYFQETRNNVNAESLTGAPDEQGGELAFNQGDENNSNVIKLLFSHALNTQTGISFTHQHKIGTRLKLEVQLAANDAATENAALRLMGRTNQLGMESTYGVDGNTQWILGLTQSKYFSIDGQELGSGSLLTTTLSHELSGVRPALHTRMTGTWYQFQNADTILSGLTASLIPAGEPHTAAYFMPQDVNEVAAYIRLGDTTDSTAPARDVEAYVELGGFNNQTTGSGFRASAGLAGSVLGADRLQMFIHYDQSPNGQEFASLQAGIAYLLHY